MAPATLIEAPQLLDLDYAATVPADVLAQVEVFAKDFGMPLAQIELLGQDLNSCRDFVHIANAVGVEAAVQTVDWLLLEELYKARN